ncbi:MAG: hypothetical protein ABI175_29405 [Polyangiales bacterium]
MAGHDPDAARPERWVWWPAFLLFALLLGFWGYRHWREGRTHHVVLRALGVDTCRVRVEFAPGKPLDALEQQTGVLTPWQREVEPLEGTDLSLRVYGDASCEAITCEIEVDGVVISRKTQATKGNPGVDSASCQAIAVDTHH